MSDAMPVLLLSPRYSSDSRLLRAAAERAGWRVVRLGGRSIPDFVSGRDLVFYGEPAYADVVADSREIALLQPDPGWLPALPEGYRRRAVRGATLEEAVRLGQPAFVKAALERKPFPSAVYEHGNALRAAADRDVPGSLPVLVAEPVDWQLELRCFVREGKPLALSPYLREGRPALAADGTWPLAARERGEAMDLVASLLADARVALPPAVALDVGCIADRGWAVIEINSAWGSGLYGCDPAAVLPVLARASVPRESLTDADRPWTRPRRRPAAGPRRG